jgi:hypothetical protein
MSGREVRISSSESGVRTDIVRARWYLRNDNSAGPADLTFVYGTPTDEPRVWK